MNDVYDDEPHAVAWGDIFPWIPSFPWKNEAASDTDEEAVGAIVQSALHDHRSTTFGELFSSLDDDVQLLRLGLSDKAERNLRANDIYIGRELKALSMETLFDWRGFGEGAVTKFLQRLTRQAVRSALEGETVWNPGDGIPEDPAPPEPRPAEEIARALEDLAEWFIAIGAPDVPLLSPQALAMGTERTIDIHDDFLSLSALDVLAPDQRHSPIAAVFSEIVQSLDDRQIKILRERTFSTAPATLDELGAGFGLTRERIRQVENKAKNHIVQAFNDSTIIQELLALIQTKVREIRPLDDLLHSYPALRETIAGTSQPLWFILSRLDKDFTQFNYVIEDDWVLPGSRKSAIDRTVTDLEAEANEYGVLPLDQVDIVATQHVDAEEANRSWLEYCNLTVDDTYVYLKSGNHGDRVCAILSISGTPLSTEAIESKLPGTFTFRSVLNAIQADDRITRVDRTEYALAEWGMPAYEGIKSSISNYLEEHDGQASISEMVTALTSKYDVASSSVRAYAAAPPFQIEDGIVYFAEPGARSKKRAEDTPRLFRADAGWKYRMTVTSDHLRGSGFGVPMSFATIFDLRFGDRRDFSHPLGAQTVSWTTNIVAVGSIRRILVEHNIPDGAEIFLYFGDDDSFEVIEARKQAHNYHAEPIKEVARLLDEPAEATDTEVFAALRRAVGASPTIMPFPLASLLQAKGDTDLAKALNLAVDVAKRTPR